MFNIIAIRLREQYVATKAHADIRFYRSRQLHEQHNRVPGVGIHRRVVRQLKFADTTSTKFVHCVGNELMKCRHYLPEVSLNDHGGWFLGAQLVGRCLPPRTCAYVCHFPPALLQNNNRLIFAV